MNDHLLYSKTQNVIDELNHIITFINELERHGIRKSKVYNQIGLILQILESDTLSPEHIRTVNILTKYLSGIKDFLSMNKAKGVLFYKRLFESTLVAIMQDLYSPKRKIAQY